MTKNPKELELIESDARLPSIWDIEIAFARLIGPLATITMLKTYKDSHKEYKELLYIILKWSANYMMTRDLSLIHHVELLDVYNRLFELRCRWLFEKNMGDTNELSNDVVIWIWELMVLRKQQIEHRKGV